MLRLGLGGVRRGVAARWGSHARNMATVVPDARALARDASVVSGSDEVEVKCVYVATRTLSIGHRLG